jgi:predicted Zn-dependent peptidase
VLPNPASPFHAALIGFHGSGFDAKLRAAASAVSWARSYTGLSPSVHGRMSRGAMETDSMWTMLRSTGSNVEGTLDALHQEISGFTIDWPPPQFQVIAKSLEQQERAPREVWHRRRHARLFGDHPYAAQGSVAAMRKVTATEVYEVLNQLRQPKNAILIIVGDVDEARAAASATSLFKSWHAGGADNHALPPPPALRTLPAATPALLRVDWPGASLATLGLDCVLPPATSPAQEAALDLFETVSERALFEQLRNGQPQAYAVDVDLEKLRGGTSVLNVTTSVTHAHIESAFQVLSNFVTTPGASFVSDARLAGARSQRAREYNLSFITTAALARSLFDSSQRGWELGTLDDYPDHLLSATPGDVASIAEHCRNTAFLSVLSDPARTPSLAMH